MINAHKYTTEQLAAIQSALEPEEEGLALCEFTVSGTQGNMTPKKINLVLTNRYIRGITFKLNWLGQLPKNPVVGSNLAITLRAISAISTEEFRQILGPKVINLIFCWEGHREDVFTTWLDEGKTFAEKLREAVGKKEVASSSASMADELQKLAQLTKEGILSQEEYERAKNQLIGVSSSQVDEATKLLRQLHELRTQGVLSESEFNMKKWDVLSQRLIPRDKPS